MNTTTVHFDRRTDNNVRVQVVDHEGGYLVYVADLDVAQVVGRKYFTNLQHALSYANACVDGWTPAGTFVTI